MWTGQGGEGAKFWHTMLMEIRNRSVKDVLMLVCDGLTPLPQAVAAIWPHTVVHTYAVDQE